MIDELLKELKEKAQELSNNHWGDDERHLIGKGIQCMYVQAENIIRSKLKIGGWIPCSDRLPEEKGWYLAYAKNQRPFVAYFKGKTFPLNNHYHEIVAWTPLQEAYHEQMD